jgi:peptidoglycan/xylan/chitin deacetylase (PgdA/CDA1 family)
MTFDLDADSFLHSYRPQDSWKRVGTISSLRYGPTVGVPRILETYAQLDIRQTFFVPGWCAEVYPEAVEKIHAAGHEIGLHGYIHEHNCDASNVADEAYWIDKSMAILEKITGRKPVGSRSPFYNLSPNTAELLAERGFLYDASCMADDVPYIMQTKKGDVIALPTHWACDDWPPYVQIADVDYMMQVQSPDFAIDLFRSEFDAQYEYGGLFILTAHPSTTGRLARWRKTAKFLEELKTNYNVWFAPMEEIALHVKKLVAEGRWSPRTETQPYYTGPVEIN